MGRKQFETVVAQASREQLKQYDNEVSTVVPANGGIEEILIYASPSNIGKIVGMYVDMPKVVPIQGSVTGYHDVYMSYKVNNSGSFVNIDIAHGASGPATQVTYQYSNWASADAAKIPDNTEVGRVLQGCQFDSSVPFRIAYSNGTTSNTDGSSKRKYHITYVEREVRL